MKRVRLSTLFVLDLSFRVIGVRAGLFWVRVACVPSSSLLLAVYTSSCICFATRIALCVCCFLSIFVVAVWRCSSKDGTEPCCVGRGCGAGFVGAVARPSFAYVSCSGRFDLLAVDGVRAFGALQRASLWCCSSRSRFLKTFFFAMCVSITMSDSDRGG